MPRRSNDNPDRLRRDLQALVGQLHPDDGLPPDELRKRDRHPSGVHVKQRKLLALCRQVQRALQLALPADLELDVASVSPDLDPGRLIVLLVPTDPDQRPSDDQRQRLAALAAPLRAEVARAITRKRVPELAFRLSS